MSFWIGAHLDNRAAAEQQTLLELTDTHDRLHRQFEMLDHTRRQLAARTVLMDLK
jgi:ATP-dependent Lon protease